MQFTSTEISQLFFEKNVQYLYHANSVETSCTYLTAGALLSRGEVERRGLAQTPQYTDATDKALGVWDDIFLDTIDIHAQAGRDNSYGPVLFEFELSLIRGNRTNLAVSMTNPSNWEKADWFSSLWELKRGFSKTQFEQMLVFRNCGLLSFSHDLRRVILDDPAVVQRVRGINYFDTAERALKDSMTLGQVQVPIVRRKCKVGCGCVKAYSGSEERCNKLFFRVSGACDP